MRQKLVLVGDINLLGVTDPSRPFAKVGQRLEAADAVFANLECCLYDRPPGRSAKQEGFYAGRQAGAALKAAFIDVVGTANNVTFGQAAIEASLDELDALGVLHAGAGRGATEAHAPAIITRDGLRLGFMQRTSIYWPTEHEAVDEEIGVAVLRGHTAYSPVLEFNGLATRPGVPARVITWADPDHLAAFRDEVADLRKQADYVVCSHHWGYREDVLEYQQQYAHAAIEAGADLVFGHGPHHPQPIEIYQGKPIFYCVGSFFFESGHRGRVHGNWVGLAVSVDIVNRQAERIAFRFVRRSDGATHWCTTADETAELDRLRDRSKSDYGTDLLIDDDEVVAWQRPSNA